VEYHRSELEVFLEQLLREQQPRSKSAKGERQICISSFALVKRQNANLEKMVQVEL
jgi:hypothetical protein